MTSDDRKLDNCGCCKGGEPRQARYNRPGLPAIEYRLDTHSGFFKRALAKLPHPKDTNGSQTLPAPTTRSRDDFAIALLDAWAIMADVISFYQERAANEGFLRTLQERVSALLMARAIGYELKPGVAASVHLAFTMDESPGSPKTTIVPKGLAVKSIPPPGKLPQTFETSKDLEARVEWNALTPLLTEEQRVGSGATEVLLEGIDTSLQPGDAVLFVAARENSNLHDESWQKCAVTEAEYGPDNETVTIKWNKPLKERARSLRLEGVHRHLKVGDPILFERECGESRSLEVAEDFSGGMLAAWEDPLPGRSTQLLIKNVGTGIKSGDEILFGPVRGLEARVLQRDAALLKKTVGDLKSDITLLILENPYPSQAGSRKILIDGDYTRLKSGDAIVFAGESRQLRTLKSVEVIDGKTRIAWEVPLFGGFTDLLLTLLVSTVSTVSIDLKAGDNLIFMDADREVRTLNNKISEFSGRYLATWTDPLIDGSRGLLLDQDCSQMQAGASLLFEGDPWQVLTVVEAWESVDETLLTFNGPIEKGTMQFLVKGAGDRLKATEMVRFGGHAWQVRAINHVEASSDSIGNFTLISWELPLFGKYRGMRLTGTGETIIVNDQIWFECHIWQMRILTTVTADPELNSTLVTWNDPLADLGDPEDELFVNPTIFAMRERPDLDRSNLAEGKIDLEGTYSRVLPGSWVAMTLNEGLCKVMTVSLMSPERIVQVPRPGYGSPLEFRSKVKITRIEPDAAQGLSEFADLETAIFAQSEPLRLAARRRQGLIEGQTIQLDRAVYGLDTGKILIASGKLMRAGVGIDGLKLFSSNDIEKAICKDDSLQVLRSPEAVELLWTLKDQDSCAGETAARVGDIDYVSGSGADGKAQVEVKSDGLKLISPEGESRDLARGEILEAMDRPESISLCWTLRDGDGFEGTVTSLAEDISLQPALDKDLMECEVVILSGTERSGGRTILSLKDPMENCYDPSTFLAFANIVLATHGETVEDVLGSGDGTKSNQSFELSKPYLTYVSAPTSSGTRSTLQVRVNGVLWKESPSLYGLDERSQSFIARIDDSALASVIFGDGRSGARLPTGDENVIAAYRNGIGPDGEVDRESLTLLMSRPLGISEVTNPLPASGAAAPEELSDARHNAPLTVLTLDRIVSLRDFEYFVRSFAGIGKAQAVSLSRAQSKVVHITIASSSGTRVERGSDLHTNLVKAIDAMRDPVARVAERVIVESFSLQTFSMQAGVIIDSRYLEEDVLVRAEAELQRTFSFENRNFGQFVTAAEILAVIQAVEGVIAVDLDRLERDDSPKAGTSLTAVLQAKKARIDEQSGDLLPAEILLLNPSSKGILHSKELKS